ncbi:hypothetical protein ACFE04_004615 [Oxalis oulophora]
MDKILGKHAINPHNNNYDQQLRYANVGGPTNQTHQTSTNNINNTNVRPPDYNINNAATGSRPVLNFSIQTGEEFDLQFMQERVNPRQQQQQQHPIPNNAYNNDIPTAAAAADRKGILGIVSNSQTSASSAISDSKPNNNDKGISKRKLKSLCSFGGCILPRPSDGKLRFVGGDTRIIQISENISWQELKQKATSIYSQTQTIKYQLPGEDLDALVSVSCDEDLQNMMEECSVLEQGGLQKPRMFLFSNDDIEDAQYSLGTVEADSEIKFVVAVNGFDLGSRRNSIALASASGNNLDEFLNLNNESETSRVVAESAHGHLTQQGGLVEGQVKNSVVHTEDLDGSAKDVKMKTECSGPKMKEPAKTWSVDREMQLKELKMKIDPSFPKINETENINMAQDQVVQSPMPPESKNEARKNNEENHLYESGGALIPGYGDSEGGSTHEAVIPPRVFHSERIPREQAETNRLSKSNDSFGSQFLAAQASQITEIVDNLHDVNSNVETQQSSLSAKMSHTNPQTIEDKISKTRPDIPDTGPELNKPKSETREVADNNKIAIGLNHPIETQVASGKHVEDSARQASDSKTNQVSEQGDIFIDINDRFSHDFMSDIFSMAATARDSTLSLQTDGSLHMENLDPKHWSYFQNLAQDEYVRNDVSLMDQDHLGFSSQLTNIEEGVPPRDYNYPPAHKFDGHVESHVGFDEDIQRSLSTIMGYDTRELAPDNSHSQMKDSKRLAPDAGNLGIQESAYEGLRVSDAWVWVESFKPYPIIKFKDQVSEHQNANAPLLDLPAGEFDISSLQIILNEDLEELRELGSGTFGTVYHGKWRGSDVAIKRIKKSCFTGRSSEQERLTLEFWREAEILSKLHHPNVLAFYGVVQDGPGGTLATVAEFMVNGSLRHVLLSKERHLDRRKRLIIAMDAAFGMEYLHSKNIVHFDLKCDNLLVNLKDPARPICKVGDFGLSKMKRNTLVTGGVRGTLPWMAPELLNGSSSKVSEKVDVFSFGIVLWEILTGEEPYANMHYGAIIGGIVNNTLRPLVPSFCDSEWQLLMEQCWAPDPVVRPSFTEIARRLRVMSAACQTKQNAHQPQNQASKKELGPFELLSLWVALGSFFSGLTRACSKSLCSLGLSLSGFSLSNDRRRRNQPSSPVLRQSSSPNRDLLFNRVLDAIEAIVDGAQNLICVSGLLVYDITRWSGLGVAASGHDDDDVDGVLFVLVYIIKVLLQTFWG